MIEVETESIQTKINPDEWSYVEPRLFNRQLAAALKHPEIQEAFHDACTVAAAGKRLDSLIWHKYKLLPKPFEPRVGELLRPIDIETSDWRWSQSPGRPPLWHYYITSHLCHWLCYPNLLLAELLFPQVNWCIVSTEKHSTVVNFESKLVFDLYYSACQVPIDNCLKLLFGDELSSEDYEIHSRHTYSYRDGMSGMAEELFERLDSHEGDVAELLEGLKEVMEGAEDEQIITVI